MDHASQGTTDAIAAVTDADLWAMTLGDSRTAEMAMVLCHDHAGWSMDAVGGTHGIKFEVTRLHLDLPRVAGYAMDSGTNPFGDLPRVAVVGRHLSAGWRLKFAVDGRVTNADILARAPFPKRLACARYGAG
ncbi:hypothetical protein ABIB25_005935 [Nakamurella sp. UYEF19]|uniref:hypothetical protein n=1 Tax=Nakamurella sp. UYEF19 TaxID=1756392 RepID=UPI003391DE05